jgi:hypothetical protein
VTLTVATDIELGGLVINAGLLIGLIFQIRTAATSRRQDLYMAMRRATLDAWSSVSTSGQSVETETSVYFGRGEVEWKRVVTFDVLVTEATERRRSSGSEPSGKDQLVLKANRDLQLLLNAANEFAIGVELGAYDRETAQRAAGWRMARLLRHYLGYVALVRIKMGEEKVWGSLETFVRTFLKHENVALNGEWDLSLLEETTATRRALVAEIQSRTMPPSTTADSDAQSR